MYQKIKTDLETALNELYEVSKVEEGDILVVGCSSSEVLGKKIGTGGSEEAAKVIFETIRGFCTSHSIFLAAQCCEHLNRCLVVEKECAKKYNLSRVNAIPHAHAGGAFATSAYKGMTEPYLVEEVSAHIGIDIGNTLIGMHIKKVCVPVRTSIKKLGEAPVTFARSRCKYVGGERAIYNPELS